ncbi:T9SS type A sorting domain-containing protein [Mesohalobacter halotolerans]|uniref:T9SS type A sorting domain-containing protein n=1 Tax=Mesohalobacter halotolerans TaxID=1883405 RepID=A0A4U5TPE8_9FLAO|nr:T9SS type A sorting domain-containing protein [Mesohalobacter halotolerans]
MFVQKLNQLELSASAAPLKINVIDLAAGNYFIRLTTQEQSSIVKRFIKR